MRTRTMRQWLAVTLVAAGMASGAARADSVNLALAVINPLRAPLTVSVPITQPTGLSGLVSFTGMLGVLLLDTTANGASLAPVGGFIMEGLINGVPVGTDSLGTLTASLLPTGVFSGTFNCGGACNSLTLLINFVLSPFDVTTVLANFTVNEVQFVVPEPAPWQLLLLLLALGALMARRPRGPSTPH
ncbi:MAG: hypothetical protein U1F48_20085 [Burkholderiales bacterium]